MKTLNLIWALCLMLFTYVRVSAQDSKDKNIDFLVTGNCGMCKINIESSLIGNPGIKSAEWNMETKMMNVVFDPAKISEEQIHQKIADTGYDMEKNKASDKVYNSLPGCCRYKRTIQYE